MLKARLKCAAISNSLIALACHIQTSVRNSAIGSIAEFSLNLCTLYAFYYVCISESLK